MARLNKKALYPLSLLSLAIISISPALAYNCTFSADGKTNTCTNNGAEENNRIVDQYPSYQNLVIANTNLANPNTIIFGLGPGANSIKYGDLTVSVVNSTLTANTDNSWQWTYGIYNGVGASTADTATEKAIISIQDSTINVKASDVRTNGAVAEAGFSNTGIGSAIVNVSNSTISTENSDTADRGSSGVGATANYIAEVITDANSSISTTGGYTPAIALRSDNVKVNPLDNSLNNGHQQVENAATLTTNGKYSNAIHSYHQYHRLTH